MPHHYLTRKASKFTLSFWIVKKRVPDTQTAGILGSDAQPAVPEIVCGKKTIVYNCVVCPLRLRSDTRDDE